MATTAPTLSAGGCPCWLRAESRQSATAAAKGWLPGWLAKLRLWALRRSAAGQLEQGHGFGAVAQGEAVWSAAHQGEGFHAAAGQFSCHSSLIF